MHIRLSLMKSLASTDHVRRNECPVAFHCDADPTSRVSLVGTFNHWQPGQTLLVDPEGEGRFRLRLRLPPGEIEYKFVIDDEWVADVECPRWCVNEHGSLNSVREVK